MKLKAKGRQDQNQLGSKPYYYEYLVQIKRLQIRIVGNLSRFTKLKVVHLAVHRVIFYAFVGTCFRAKN